MGKRIKRMATSLYEDSVMLQQEHASTDEDGTPIIRRVVGNGMADTVHALSFAFLGCEDAFGYGPIEHTAELFLDLICLGCKSNGESDLWTVSIFIYNAKDQVYPSQESLKEFSGVILPGSISSAYEENVPWIDALKVLIMDVIVPNQIPTLGICFGHQIMAQSLNGKVGKIPEHSSTEEDQLPLEEVTNSKSRAGRVSFRSSDSGKNILGKQQLELYATHGDHVEYLPPEAICLGGDNLVPIQAAAYYGTVEEAQNAEKNHDLGKPFAITFQSHLEYGTSKDLGLIRTLETLIEMLHEKALITKEYKDRAKQDARDQYDNVESDSIEAMVMTGRVLGWFPTSD